MMSIGNKVSNSAMSRLDEIRKLSEVPKTKLALETGVNRHTVAKYLSTTSSATFGAFIDTAIALGADPVQILSDALQAQGKCDE